MGKQGPLARYQLTGGYSSSRGFLEGGDIAQLGSENLLFGLDDRPIAFPGMTIMAPTVGGRQLYNFDNGYAALLDNASTAKGSIFMIASGKTMAYIGSGHVYYNGVTMGRDASTTPRLLLLRGGLYTGAGTGPYDFGLSQPSAPDFAVGTYGAGGQVTGQGPLTGKLKGAYSIAITKIRSFTGAESLPSLTSAVITASAAGNFSRITLPSIGANGADRWGIYVTQSGFGPIGPQFFYVEVLESDVTATRAVTASLAAASPNLTLTVGALTANDVGRSVSVPGVPFTSFITSVLSGTTADLSGVVPAAGAQAATITQAVDGVLRSIPLEWLDADLVGGQLPPIDNDAPQPGWFGFSLQDATAIVGSLGDQTDGVASSPGNVVQVSRPGFPEAFPVDQYLFLPETPVCVQERAADNYAFIWGANSLCACTYTGGATPLDLQLIWNNIGISAPHNATIVDGRVYAMTGTGLVRMGNDGQPDRIWTAAVLQEMQALTPATVVLGYDANLVHLLVMSGSSMWAFNVVTEKWSSKLNLATLNTPIVGNIVSAVTINGSLKVGVLNGSTFNLYTWAVGGGSTWKVFTSWQTAGTMDLKTVETIMGAFQHDNAGTFIDLGVFTTNRRGEFDLTTARRSWKQYVPNAGRIIIKPKKVNATDARAFSIYMSGTSAGSIASGPIELTVEGTISPVRV